MEKILLPTIFAGCMVALFYAPTPVENLTKAVENDTFYHIRQNQSARQQKLAPILPPGKTAAGVRFTSNKQLVAKR